jgi:hypothetical protein
MTIRCKRSTTTDEAGLEVAIPVDPTGPTEKPSTRETDTTGAVEPTASVSESTIGAALDTGPGKAFLSATPTRFGEELDGVSSSRHPHNKTKTTTNLILPINDKRKLTQMYSHKLSITD